MAPTAITGGGRTDVDALIRQYKQSNREDSDDDDVSVLDPEKERKQRPFVDWPAFNGLVGIVIAVNALTIGLETDAKTRGEDDSSPIWLVLEIFFCVAFLVELCCRLFFHGWGYFTHPTKRLSNCLDAFIVMISVLDTFILLPINAGGTARLVAMLRLLRLTRLIRLIRLFKLFKELWLVANGLLQVLRTLVWVCTVLFLVCCIFGIFLTHWVGHNDELYDAYFRESGGWDHAMYFNTVLRSMITLFQVATLDQWSDSIVRHVIKKQPLMIIFFVAFITITSFGILNIIIGVTVESTINAASKDEGKLRAARERDRQIVFAQLRDIFEAADADSSGTLTLDEVKDALNKPEIYNKLKMIDFPVEEPGRVFALLDYEECGELSIDDFISGCLRMKGAAKSKDLLVAQVAIDAMRRHCGTFEAELDAFTEKLRLLSETAASVVEHGEHLFLDARRFRGRHPSMRGNSLPTMRSSRMEAAPWQREHHSEDER